MVPPMRRGRLVRAGAELAARVACAAAVTALCRTAAAQPAPRIVDNNYTLEVFQGPVLASSRLSGLAGAYSAVAESVDGVSTNPAASAVRPSSSTEWFDWDATASLSFPGAYGGTDFANRGPKGDPALVARTDSFLHAVLGGAISLGRFGLAASTDLLEYDLSDGTAGSPTVKADVVRTHVDAGYGLSRGQIVVGAGLRGMLFQLDERSAVVPIGSGIRQAGFAPEVGVIVKPNAVPWRVGATLRSPLSSSLSTIEPGVTSTVGSFVAPRNVVMPWEAEIGGAWQLGPRPLNIPWRDPHDEERRLRAALAQARSRRADERVARIAKAEPAERSALAAREAAWERAIEAAEDERVHAELERLRAARAARDANWPRQRVLLLASVLVTGASPSAVAIEGFFAQRNERVGRSVSLSPRLAVESEPIADWVVLRAGTYVEPSRFADGHARQHFTFGGDVRLGRFDAFGLLGPSTAWRLSAFADFAPRFTNLGFGVGTWH